jgi:hypothetical protein
MTYYFSVKVVRLTIGVSILSLLCSLLPAVLILTASYIIESDRPETVVDLEAGLAAEEVDLQSHHHALPCPSKSHGSVAGLCPSVLCSAGRGDGVWLAAMRPPVSLTAFRFICYRSTLCPPADPFLL